MIKKSNETNIKHLHLLFFDFVADDAFFDKFLSLHNETRNANSHFKMTNLKIKPWKSAPNTGQNG